MATNMPKNVVLAHQRLDNIQIQEIGDAKRILLAMLDHIPLPGLSTFADEINRCSDDNELVQLSEHYISTLFKPLRAAGGQSPAPTPSPFFAEMKNEVEELEERLSPSQGCGSTRDLEIECLPRDGYKCIVTRVYSDKAPPGLRPAGAFQDFTRTCHIIPFALAHYKSRGQELYTATSIWVSLCRIFPGLRSRIADNLHNINDPRNMFTGHMNVHDLFGRFELALEHLGENRYRLVYWDKAGRSVISSHFPPDNIIQLTAANHVPLPDPYLFQTHLAVASILHASGLGEILDQTLEDCSTLDGLAADGSTNIPHLIERRHPLNL